MPSSHKDDVRSVSDDDRWHVEIVLHRFDINSGVKVDRAYQCDLFQLQSLLPVIRYDTEFALEN